MAAIFPVTLALAPPWGVTVTVTAFSGTQSFVVEVVFTKIGAVAAPEGRVTLDAAGEKSAVVVSELPGTAVHGRATAPARYVPERVAVKVIAWPGETAAAGAVTP
jgi:hypothetical protein